MDFYQRVAASTFADPGEPPPSFYAGGMLALIERLRADPELSAARPGLYRRTLTLRPVGVTRKIFVRWVADELYEIEVEGGGALYDLPWDGKIVVPGDVVIEALVNCKRRLEGEEPPHSNGQSKASEG